VQRYGIVAATVDTLLVMAMGTATSCANCRAPLDPAWKFCIYCGTAIPVPVEQVSPAPAGTAVPAAIPAEIPAAIRPAVAESLAADAPAKAGRRLDVPLLIGIVLGSAGVVLIAYIAIVLFGPHG
jgi:hypothetical protein